MPSTNGNTCHRQKCLIRREKVCSTHGPRRRKHVCLKLVCLFVLMVLACLSCPDASHAVYVTLSCMCAQECLCSYVSEQSPLRQRVTKRLNVAAMPRMPTKEEQINHVNRSKRHVIRLRCSPSVKGRCPNGTRYKAVQPQMRLNAVFSVFSLPAAMRQTNATEQSTRLS